MSPLRVVHVGVGLWGRSWAELIAGAPGYRLVGVADAGCAGPGVGRAGAPRSVVSRPGAGTARDRRRRRRAGVAARDAQASRRAGARRGLSRDRGEAARADARRCGRDRGCGCSRRPSRDGVPELPLPAAVAGPPRPRSGRRPRPAARDPHLLQARPARRLDLAPRLARPDAPSVPARHGDPPRRHAPHDHGRRGGRGRRAQLGGARRAVQARSHGGGAPHARRRHAGLAGGHVGGAALADVVERRLGARGLPGRATWSGGVGDALRGTVRLRPTSRAGSAVRAADAPGASTGTACSPSCVAPWRRASGRSARPPTTCAASPSIFALARSTEERGPVRVGELLAG